MKLDKLVKLEKDKQIQVKAGDSLGKLGAYDSKTIDNKEKLIHLEVFTFGDWDGFKKKSKDAYEKEDEKTRPKANKLHIPKDVQRYEKEDTNGNLKVILKKAGNLRPGVDSNKGEVVKVLAEGTILTIKPELSKAKRYELVSIDSGDVSLSDEDKETNKVWSIYETSVKVINVFNKIAKTETKYYKEINKPLKTLKKLKDKDGTEYIKVETLDSVDVYVKDDKKYKTHGITFDKFKYFSGAGSDKIGIFENIMEYLKKGDEGLNEQYGKILKFLKKSVTVDIDNAVDKKGNKLDKNENGKLDAKEFAVLSATNENAKEALRHVLIQHESEWEDSSKWIFDEIVGYLRGFSLEEAANMLEDRLDNLVFNPKTEFGGKDAKTPTFIHPIAFVDGFVGGGCGSDCKTIDFELSNGKYFKVSEQTLKFILSYEGFKTYAYVPKDVHGNVLGSSGITIGYGYDLGQQTSTQIASDLNGLYTSAEIVKFQSVAGLKKQSAVNKLSNVNTKGYRA